MLKRISAIVICLILILSLSVAAFAAPLSPEEQLAQLLEISNLMSLHSMTYKGASTNAMYDTLLTMLKQDPTLYNKMITQMFSKLDTYSHFMPKTEYDVAFPSGEPYVGIGMIVNPQYRFGCVVKDTVAGGAARDAGLKPNDVLLTVDNAKVELLPYTEVVPLLRGKADTTTTITVRREGVATPLSFTLRRKPLSTSNIQYVNQGQGVGMITISRFDSVQDLLDFLRIYNSIPYDDGIKSVIIDLRNNPGGDVAVTYNMLNYIIPKQKIPLFALQNKVDFELFSSTGVGVWTPNALVILVNGNSASASEIFAGSLQQHKLATLVGTQTYGKGRSQVHVPLTDGSMAVITSYEIVLPDAKPYDGIGLTPDYIVEQVSKPYVMPDFVPLDTTVAILPTANSNRVLALEQRLALLGLFPGTPDTQFTETTRFGIQVLQKSLSIPTAAYANVATLKALQAELDRLTKQAVVGEDLQLAKALELARDAAKRPLLEALPPQNDTLLTN